MRGGEGSGPWWAQAVGTHQKYRVIQWLLLFINIEWRGRLGGVTMVSKPQYLFTYYIFSYVKYVNMKTTSTRDFWEKNLGTCQFVPNCCRTPIPKYPQKRKKNKTTVFAFTMGKTNTYFLFWGRNKILNKIFFLTIVLEVKWRY